MDLSLYVVRSILLFGPRRVPSLHPDPLVLNAGGQGACQGWPSRDQPHTRFGFQAHSLTGPEPDGTLALVGGHPAAWPKLPNSASGWLYSVREAVPELTQ